MAADTTKTLYWLDPRFERLVVLSSCRSPKFWARIGHAVDPELLGAEEAKLAMRAARQVATDTRSGPPGTAIVLQRLRRWMEEGKTSYEQVLAVGDFLLDAEADPPLAEDALVKELAPLLKKRIRADVVRKTMAEFSQDEDDGEERPFIESSKLIEKAATLGDAKVADAGIRLGGDSYDAMEAVKVGERLGTGVEELDLLLKGGPRRGGFTLWLGATGSGKSTSLAHQGAYAMLLGKHCAIATLELPRETQFARIKANLTGVPIDDILDEPRMVEEQLSKMALGAMHIQNFTSYVTTMTDIVEWVDLVEQKEGAHRGVERVPLDLLLIDYGDLVGLPSSAGKEAEGGYTVGKHVFGAMRVYAEGGTSVGDGGHPGGPIWVSTASAATRAKDKRKRITTEDVADSMHKVRRPTLVVSINPQEDGTVEFYCSKNTHGAAQFSVGPLPADFACARISPVKGLL